jgi:hypothetical protein
VASEVASGVQQFCVGPDADPDKYKLVTQVGAGGEATLWRAAVTVVGEPETVAVKVLRPGLVRASGSTARDGSR